MANATLQQILTAQNTYITNGNAARARAEGKLDTALDALADLASYRYPVAQGITMQTALDDDYTAICDANEGFADRGAVGITVLARDGDVIPRTAIRCLSTDHKSQAKATRSPQPTPGRSRCCAAGTSPTAPARRWSCSTAWRFPLWNTSRKTA